MVLLLRGKGCLKQAPSVVAWSVGLTHNDSVGTARHGIGLGTGEVNVIGVGVRWCESFGCEIRGMGQLG